VAKKHKKRLRYENLSRGDRAWVDQQALEYAQTLPDDVELGRVAFERSIWIRKQDGISHEDD